MSRTPTSDIPNDALLPTLRIRAPLRCEGVGSLDSAEETRTGERMAVRWLPVDANARAAVLAMTRLPQHPTLPRVRHSGEVGNHLWAAVDFPEGHLLTQGVGRTEAPSRIIEIGHQLAQALGEVHAQGFVHGELSTDSVLLVNDGRALLWDMPLVVANRLTDRRGEQRLMSLLPKTAAFLSPERARGQMATEASDVYALGVALLVVAGADMPSGPTLGIVHQVSSGAWRPTVPASLPRGLQALLSRMVETDASLRPSAREVSRALAEQAIAAPSGQPDFLQNLDQEWQELAARRPLSMRTSGEPALESQLKNATDLEKAHSLARDFDQRNVSDLPPFGEKAFVAAEATPQMEAPLLQESIIVSPELPVERSTPALLERTLDSKRPLSQPLFESLYRNRLVSGGLFGVFLMLLGMGIIFSISRLSAPVSEEPRRPGTPASVGSSRPLPGKPAVSPKPLASPKPSAPAPAVGKSHRKTPAAPKSKRPAKAKPALLKAFPKKAPAADDSDRLPGERAPAAPSELKRPDF